MLMEKLTALDTCDVDEARPRPRVVEGGARSRVVFDEGARPRAAGKGGGGQVPAVL